MGSRDLSYIDTTDHEAGILRVATSLSATIKTQRWAADFTTWAECKAATEEAAKGLRVGAIVYANGIYNGIESAALYATYREGKGWKFSNVRPEGITDCPGEDQGGEG